MEPWRGTKSNKNMFVQVCTQDSSNQLTLQLITCMIHELDIYDAPMHSPGKLSSIKCALMVEVLEITDFAVVDDVVMVHCSVLLFLVKCKSILHGTRPNLVQKFPVLRRSDELKELN